MRLSGGEHRRKGTEKEIIHEGKKRLEAGVSPVDSGKSQRRLKRMVGWSVLSLETPNSSTHGKVCVKDGKELMEACTSFNYCLCVSSKYW